MQTTSFRIWTRVAVSNSNDGKHYTTDTFSLYKFLLFILICFLPYIFGFLVFSFKSSMPWSAGAAENIDWISADG